MNEILKLQTPALSIERFCHVSSLPMELFYHPFTMIQRNTQEMNVQKHNKTQNTLPESEMQVAQQAIHGFPSTLPFCDRQTSAVLELCVFLYVSSYCNKGSHTFLSGSHTQFFVFWRTTTTPFQVLFQS